jgi:hypothetical protein
MFLRERFEPVDVVLGAEEGFEPVFIGEIKLGY